MTTFKKSSLSDNICNVVHRVIDVDCACWHDLTVTVSLFHARFPRARGQQNTATTGHLSVLKPLNPSTPLSRLFFRWQSRVNLTFWDQTSGKKSDTTVFNPCPFFIAFLNRSRCPAPPGKLFFGFSNFWLTYRHFKKDPNLGFQIDPWINLGLASANKNSNLIFSTRVYVILRGVRTYLFWDISHGQ